MALREKYKIHAGPIPSITISVDSGEKIMCSPGALLGRDPAFSQTTEIYKSKSGKGRAVSSFLSGESLFINRFVNRGNSSASITFSDETTGTIIEISDQDLNQSIMCLKGSFLAAIGDVDIGLKKVRHFSNSYLTGGSMWMQSCQKDPKDTATVFLMSPSEPVRKELGKGEIQILDNSALFAMTEGIQIKLFENEDLKSAYGGGEGRFMTVVEGPGTVWTAPGADSYVSSSPIKKLINSLIPGR